MDIEKDSSPVVAEVQPVKEEAPMYTLLQCTFFYHIEIRDTITLLDKAITNK